MPIETIKLDGESIEVTQLEIYRRYCCRVLKSASTDDIYLGYLVSVGPYKFDLEVYRALTEQQVQEYRAGALDVGALAEKWSQQDMQSGKYERKS